MNLRGTIALFVLCASVAAAQPRDAAYPVVVAGNDTRLADKARWNYRDLAAMMAWHWLNETQSPDTALVALPETLVNSLYNALIHVYNAAGVEGRDSAIASDIEAPLARFYWTESMVIDLAKAPWAQAWAAGKQRTGNRIVDSITTTFGVVSSVLVNGRRSITMQLHTDRPTRMWMIAGELENMKGVRPEADAYVTGDFGTMTATVVNGYWLLDYRMGAMNGYNDFRLADRTWSFRVYPDGRVQFVEAGYRPFHN